MISHCKTQCHSDKKGPEMRIEDVDKKIPYTSGLVKKIDQNTKTTDFENRIPSVAGLVTIGLSNIKPTKTE